MNVKPTSNYDPYIAQTGPAFNTMPGDDKLKGNVNQPFNYFPNIAQTGPELNAMLGDDMLRMPIKAELKEISQQLLNFRYIDEPTCVQCISAWHDSFLNVIQDRDRDTTLYPSLKEVTRRYVEALVLILRGPEGPETPFPRELFGNDAFPIVQFVVAKMRNRDSIFYSEQFDLEAMRVLEGAGTIDENQDGDIPPELLEQLNQFEAERAKSREKEMQSMDKLKALSVRLEQRKTAAQGNIDRVARQSFEKAQQIKEKVKNLKEADLKQRAINQQLAAKLRKEIEVLNADTECLGQELRVMKGKGDELERQGKQLQVQLNTLSATVKDKQSGFLVTAACIVASIVVSYICKRPVIITPNMVQLS